MKTLIFIKTIVIYLYFAIIMTGLITNTLTFVVFSRKRFKNTIFSTYFRFYIIFQTFNLVLPFNDVLELNFNINFSNLSNFTCKISNFIEYYNFSIPAWLTVFISIDRFITIAYPDKFLIKNRFKFQLQIFFSIAIFNFFFYLPILLFHLEKSETFNNQTNMTEIEYTCEGVGIWFYLLDLFQSILLPFTLMILTSIFTIKKVFDSRKLINNNKYKSKDIKFATITIITNFLFLAYSVPYFIYTLITDYTSLFEQLDPDLIVLFYSFVYFCLYLQFVDVFFVNFFLNSIFKSELTILLLQKRNKIVPSQIL